MSVLSFVRSTCLFLEPTPSCFGQHWSSGVRRRWSLWPAGCRASSSSYLEEDPKTPNKPTAGSALLARRSSAEKAALQSSWAAENSERPRRQALQATRRCRLLVITDSSWLDSCVLLQLGGKHGEGRCGFCWLLCVRVCLCAVWLTDWWCWQVGYMYNECGRWQFIMQHLYNHQICNYLL